MYIISCQARHPLRAPFLFGALQPAVLVIVQLCAFDKFAGKLCTSLSFLLRRFLGGQVEIQRLVL